jgi:lysozyme
MTPAGLAQLKRDEGCRLNAYQDEGGVWTIGYGCTGKGIGPGLVWTQAQADAELLERVAQAQVGLQRLWPHLAALDPVRQDVLINIAFNIGDVGLTHWPVTLGDAAAGRFAQAANDIEDNTKWEHEVGAREHRCGEAMRTGRWA